MNYFEMPDLSLKVLAILFQLKGTSVLNQPASFIAKETLASFASRLDEDDVGFVYDPESQPEICTNPGQLVGRISNSKFPYHFPFSRAVEVFSSLLNFLDDSYRKIGIVITDCFEDFDSNFITNYLPTVKGEIYVFDIGKKGSFSLEKACQEVNVNYYWLPDISELDETLKKVITL